MRTPLFIGAGALAMALLLELVLQCLPVANGLRLEASDARMPLSRYLPRQDYVYSYGWALDNARSGVTNRQGYANSPDFSERPEVLVLGNSFVESLMLDQPDTLQGQLGRQLNGAVLAAASSGNTLADTLEMARYYVPRLHPRTVVVLVDAGSMNHLLQPATRGHSQFEEGVRGVRVVHNAYVESPLKQLVSHCALVRYVYYNLKLPDWIASTLQARRSAVPATAPVSAATNAARARVFDYYLSQLNAVPGSAGMRYIFVIDGERNQLYDARHGQLNWLADNRQFLIKQLQRHGYPVLDMQPVFARHWAVQRERLDFLPMDGHWNKVAHGLAAQQLLPLLCAGTGCTLLAPALADGARRKEKTG
ncbi:hypothetical protein [Janthinobacterium sp. PC23-8]|uniref:hypothetical protein n=1 Tax=Janthinobacterium sp. PC23-8 TaxID=2012679 RepID=UPI00113FE548|nr:hypothetical protein [Janthinobacterium sp. PC23-8]